jgi:hypothetical protein
VFEQLVCAMTGAAPLQVDRIHRHAASIADRARW